ncbi:MAG: MarC family protein [Treponemataceae bacterium]
MKTFLDLSLFLLALINPVSKIAVMSVLSETATNDELKKIAWRSTLVAFLMLAVFAFAGNTLLRQVFRVELYSFQIVGGFVVFYYGFQALRQGVFFEIHSSQKLVDLSIVPIASPLIAGPATITAVISLGAEHVMPRVLGALAVALGLNLIAMLASPFLSRPLIKFNLLGALIRITGLFVASMGVNTALSGIRAFISTL